VTPTKITSPSALRPSTLLGFGLAAGAVVGALAANPVQAYQATFNLQVANETGQTSRTFIDATNDPGGWVNNTMVMTVTSLDAIAGLSRNVITNYNGTVSNTSGLCVISTICSNGTVRAATFSFSKPIKLGTGNNFTVGSKLGVWTGYSLQLFADGVQQGNNISLTDVTDSFNFFSPTTSLLLAANNAITVGLACTGTCAALTENEQFYISDVIVEAPAPLPLIGTGAAFAWTRRLRRRIKTSPVQSARS